MVSSAVFRRRILAGCNNILFPGTEKEIEVMKVDKIRLIPAILSILSVLAFGCDGSSSGSTPVQVYFPVHSTVQTTYMQMRMEERLVIDKSGYLRVGADALIIWPYGHSLRVEGNDTWVVDDEGKAVARVGDTVVLGGGFVGKSVVEEKIGYALPADATGPYFLCGTVNR
jgi:hypothetical protein